MAGFKEKEAKCQSIFEGLGEIYHLWTRENFELIFTSEEDFKTGMTIFGFSAALHKEVKVLTFELMSNHIHIAASGTKDALTELFECFKYFLSRYMNHIGRCQDWKQFQMGLRRVETLNDARNVIIYDNRNGYLVNREYTPMSYPWGANRYYFNPDAQRLAKTNTTKIPIKTRRDILRSHAADFLEQIVAFDGYALPLSFCDISTGESLFVDATHYFEKISRSIETNKAIAAEIGESLYYTDNELYIAIAGISSSKFGCPSPKVAPTQAKLELAAIMRYDYNASESQICRILKIEPDLLRSIFRK